MTQLRVNAHLGRGDHSQSSYTLRPNDGDLIPRLTHETQRKRVSQKKRPLHYLSRSPCFMPDAYVVAYASRYTRQPHIVVIAFSLTPRNQTCRKALL